MATSVQEKRVEQAQIERRRRPRLGWALGTVAALAVAAVVVATVAVIVTQPSGRRATETSTTQLYTEDELTVLRLVEQGLIPRETLDGEPFRTKALIAKGLVPRETLLSAPALVNPVYCPEERAVLAAVAAGVIPRETLDGEPYRTKALIAKGLIPRAAMPPC